MQSSIKSQNHISYTKSKYPNWILFGMIVLLLVIPMVITWIYAGEWNEGHNNWLVANSKLARYWAANNEGKWDFYQNSTGQAYVSWQPFVIPIIIWIVTLSIYTLTSYLKWTKINGYNFINGLFLMFYITIISGLWYPTLNDDGSSNQTLIISGRILIVALSFFIGFIVSLFFVNKVLVNTSLGYDYANELISDELNKQDYVNKNVTPYKHDIRKHEKKTKVTVTSKTKDKKTK